MIAATPHDRREESEAGRVDPVGKKLAYLMWLGAGVHLSQTWRLA